MTKNKVSDTQDHASEAFDVGSDEAGNATGEAAATSKGGSAASAAKAAKAGSEQSEQLSPEEELMAQLTQERDRALRAQAEFENTKKRLAQQQAQALLRASERVITALIPALDDLEFALVHAEESDNDMLEGLQAIHAKLAAVLAAEQVEIVDPLNQPFDHDTAQAVQMIEDTTKPEQTVTQVLQKGYVMGKDSDNPRVLRPAMVVVSTNPDA